MCDVLAGRYPWHATLAHGGCASCTPKGSLAPTTTRCAAPSWQYPPIGQPILHERLSAIMSRYATYWGALRQYVALMREVGDWLARGRTPRRCCRTCSTSNLSTAGSHWSWPSRSGEAWFFGVSTSSPQLGARRGARGFAAPPKGRSTPLVAGARDFRRRDLPSSHTTPHRHANTRRRRREGVVAAAQRLCLSSPRRRARGRRHVAAVRPRHRRDRERDGRSLRAGALPPPPSIARRHPGTALLRSFHARAPCGHCAPRRRRDPLPRALPRHDPAGGYVREGDTRAPCAVRSFLSAGLTPDPAREPAAIASVVHAATSCPSS